MPHAVNFGAWNMQKLHSRVHQVVGSVDAAAAAAAAVEWCSLVVLATSNISRVKPPVCRLIDKRFSPPFSPGLAKGASGAFRKDKFK